MLTYRALVGDALDLLHKVLRPYIEDEMRAVYGDQWLREARGELHGKGPSRWDTSDLLTLLYNKFFPVFRHIGHDGRSWVSLLREVRKKWAHQGELSLEETRRTLETAVLLLEAVGAPDEARQLQPSIMALMQEELQQHLEDDAAPDATAADPSAPAWGEDDEGLLSRGLEKVRSMFRRGPLEPLELRRSLLDAIERAAEPHRQHFPFNRLLVHLHAPDDRSRVLLETALEGQPEPFAEAVRRRLADARIPVPKGLGVRWKRYTRIPERLEDAFDGQPFYVELQRRKVSTTATLSVVKGRATEGRYTIRSGATVTIGRQQEVTDARGRLIRRNVVAFLDYADGDLGGDLHALHQTISRVHARILFDEPSGTFRLYDDQSTWGTSVVREGYLVPFQVRQQPVALQHGDLIYIGKACLRFATGRSR